MTHPHVHPGFTANPGGPAATRLYGPRFRRDPGQVYREMRRVHGPVAPVLLDGDVPAWLVLGYRELHYVTNTPELFGRDARRWHLADRVAPDWPLRTLTTWTPAAMQTEGAEFERRSAIVDDVLAGVDPFELRSTCERVCDELIDAFAGRGEADLIAEYARALPILVLGRLSGVAENALPDLLRMITDTADCTGPEALDSQQRLVVFFRDLIAERKVDPAADLGSAILAHPSRPTDDEAHWDLLMLVGFGQQPTTDWIGNTLRLMLTDNRFAITLSGGRRSVSQALTEVLWEDTPQQIFAGRYATRPTLLAGQHIQTGDLLLLGLAAANTDPQVRPDSFEIPSGNHAHMSFGHGDHRCPYPAQEIAETIARAAVEVLLDRLPDATLAISPDALVWRPSVWARGLSALPVHFAPS
ncbi:cytochrome P450 [Frankia sp. AgB32]|uniref:cytochrome P450 n=1 Tax=Frankia sp. AgB32 TaxID=631119 RepID=UPI0020100570|nr:cytochrome P450 [Frankia sp. AgB32]MCK9897935.1 cytochrome P450 [Frankia sp. AgB32]